MKKFLLLLCLVALITGCSSSPINRANDLLNERTNLSFGKIEKLDSVLDYPDSFDYTIKSINVSEEADTLLKNKISMLTELQNSGNTDILQRSAERAREEVINLIKVAEQYSNKAALNTLKNKAKNSSKKFLGWKYVSKNDSCTYVVYFNNDVTKILGIGKE